MWSLLRCPLFPHPIPSIVTSQPLCVLSTSFLSLLFAGLVALTRVWVSERRTSFSLTPTATTFSGVESNGWTIEINMQIYHNHIVENNSKTYSNGDRLFWVRVVLLVEKLFKKTKDKWVLNLLFNNQQSPPFFTRIRILVGTPIHRNRVNQSCWVRGRGKVRDPVLIGLNFLSLIAPKSQTT